MLSILFSIVSYLIVVFVHVLLHRHLVRIGRKTFASVGVFFIGLVVHGAVAFQFFPLPLTSIILYALLSWLHVILFTHPYLGDDEPAGKILAALRQHDAMTYGQIRDLFSESRLIEKRVRDLESGHMIEQKNKRFLPTEKGIRLHWFLEHYRKILKWESSG